MSDFGRIEGFVPWVYGENSKALAFLEREAASADVVVTHHLPSRDAVAPEYFGATLNRFFVCPIADRLTALPKLWVYGHTHTPARFELRGCRFVANPDGYPMDSRAGFDGHLVVQLEVGGGR